LRMRSSRVVREIERLTVNVEVATCPEFDRSLLPTQWNLVSGR
jgi:hypothetical protein